MSPLPPELIRTYHPLVEKDLLELGSKNLQLRAVEIIRAISRGEIGRLGTNQQRDRRSPSLG